MKKKHFLTMYALLFYASVWGQNTPLQLVSTSGGSIRTATHQIDWSIGELQVETYRGTTGHTLAQGFHQGNLSISAIWQVADLPFDIVLSPNPTVDFINLTIDKASTEDLSYTIQDAQGRVVQSAQKVVPLQHIHLGKFMAGVYFLTVEQKNVGIKSFKIIKN